AARLGLVAGIGAGRVDQRHHRQLEAVGELHQAARLAIALGLGHAEIALHAVVGVGALLVAVHDAGAAVVPAEAADDRAVLAGAPRYLQLRTPGRIWAPLRQTPQHN